MTTYVDTATGQLLTEQQIRRAYPNVTFPTPFVPPAEYVAVETAQRPDVGPYETASKTIEQVDGVWREVWTINPNPAAWDNARNTVNTNRDAAIAAGPGLLDLNNDGMVLVAPDTRDDNDLRNIDALYSRAIRLTQQGIAAPVMPFRDSTDTVFNLTPDEMISMAEYVLAFVEDKYAWSWQIKDTIAMLETADDHAGLAALDLTYNPNWSTP